MSNVTEPQALSDMRRRGKYTVENTKAFFDFSLTVKAAPHECLIRTGQP